MEYIPRRSIVVNAIKWTGNNKEDVLKFTDNKAEKIIKSQIFENSLYLEHAGVCNPGEYIVKYSDGTFSIQPGEKFERDFEEKPKETDGFDGMGLTYVVAKKIEGKWKFWNTKKNRFMELLSQATLYSKRGYAEAILSEKSLITGTYLYNKTVGAEVKRVVYKYEFM